MSANKQIVEKIGNYLNDNEDITKKEFITFVGNAFDECKGKIVDADEKVKKEKKDKKIKDEEKPKKNKPKKTNDDEEEKPKRELTAYQLFVKEQMPILKAREDAKDDGEEKKKASQLMKEIGELWKADKEAKN